VVNVFEVVQRADPDWFVNKSHSNALKVLFVEDAQFFRLLVIPVLESMGFIIRVAEDGEQAKEVLETFVPDLILTDIEMPNGNGVELAKWAKQQPALYQTIIVALTGQQEFDPDAVGNNVFVDVLSKMDSQSLAENLQRILDKNLTKKARRGQTTMSAAVAV